MVLFQSILFDFVSSQVSAFSSFAKKKRKSLSLIQTLAMIFMIVHLTDGFLRLSRCQTLEILLDKLIYFINFTITNIESQ